MPYSMFKTVVWLICFLIYILRLDEDDVWWDVDGYGSLSRARRRAARIRNEHGPARGK